MGQLRYKRCPCFAEPASAFSHNQNITFSTINTGTPVPFDTNDHPSSGITHTLGSAVFEVNETGSYNILAQPQVLNTSIVTVVRLEVWVELRVSGVWAVVPNSLAFLQIDRASSAVLPLGLILDIEAGDAFRVMCAVDDTDASLLTSPSITTSGPNAPSAIMTCLRVV